MIGISKLYCGTVEPSDALRYGRQSGKLPSHLLQFSEDKKPVVVWNCTKACNLKCVHCYSESNTRKHPDELSTAEAEAFIDDLADYGAPVLLFSGGEPLMRKDLMELVDYAVGRGLRAVISTNGTLIDEDNAREFARIGLSYIGVSLDGTREVNDAFRGVEGAFDRALRGIRIAQEAGIKVGLRFTINKRNAAEVPRLFDLLEERGIPRICFYHLVYAGRGSKLMEEDLTHDEARRTVDTIIDRTKDLHDRGKPTEVLTVDNHCDGVYLYQRLKREDPERAAGVLELLRFNGGNSSGLGIGCVSWNGDVHPDQFWRNQVLGNVRRRPFSAIWNDAENEFLMKLKNKKEHVTGRCHSCAYLNVCGGNFRCRAEAATGDPWAPDPACYLSDEELAE